MSGALYVGASGARCAFCGRHWEPDSDHELRRKMTEHMMVCTEHPLFETFVVLRDLALQPCSAVAGGSLKTCLASRVVPACLPCRARAVTGRDR